jgi:hypothetical protein
MAGGISGSVKGPDSSLCGAVLVCVRPVVRRSRGEVELGTREK